MNEAAANFIADELLRGGFRGLEGALAEAGVEVSEVKELGASDLGGILRSHPVWLRARVEGGGYAALAFRKGDAAMLAALSASGELTQKFEDGHLGELTQLAPRIFSAASAHLTTLIADDLIFETPEAVDLESIKPGELKDYIGASSTVAHFVLSVGSELDGPGVLLFARSMESRVPASALGGSDAASVRGEALVSDEEMKDILSGFGSGPEPVLSRTNGGRAYGGENLGVILDIELTATARLGQVEMSISEILSLGPGSIIDVGQLVNEPIELLVNNKLVAKGDVVVVDEKFGLRITEIVSQKERIESLR